MENSIERTNDYPVMTLISMFYNLLAYTSIVIGIIVFVVNFNDYLEYGLREFTPSTSRSKTTSHQIDNAVKKEVND